MTVLILKLNSVHPFNREQVSVCCTFSWAATCTNVHIVHVSDEAMMWWLIAWLYVQGIIIGVRFRPSLGTMGTNMTEIVLNMLQMTRKNEQIYL